MTEKAYLNTNFLPDSIVFLTNSSKKELFAADERRNNFKNMPHPLITMPDTDVMNMKCLLDSGLLMAHTAIFKPDVCLFHFPRHLCWRTRQNF
jgi:hypothetical protein